MEFHPPTLPRYDLDMSLDAEEAGNINRAFIDKAFRLIISEKSHKISSSDVFYQHIGPESGQTQAVVHLNIRSLDNVINTLCKYGGSPESQQMAEKAREYRRAFCKNNAVISSAIKQVVEFASNAAEQLR